MRDWGIEQKWMSILLPLLLLYNGDEPILCLHPRVSQWSHYASYVVSVYVVDSV